MGMNGSGPPERYGVRLANGTYRSIASEGRSSEELTALIRAEAEVGAFLRVRSDGDGIESFLRADEIVEVLDQVPETAEL